MGGGLMVGSRRATADGYVQSQNNLRRVSFIGKSECMGLQVVLSVNSRWYHLGMNQTKKEIAHERERERGPRLPLYDAPQQGQTTHIYTVGSLQYRQVCYELG